MRLRFQTPTDDLTAKHVAFANDGPIKQGRSMSMENESQILSNAESDNTHSPTEPTVSRADRKRIRRARIAWWFKLFVQPLLTVIAIVLLLSAFGLLQRMGWFTSNAETASETAAPGEEVLYICPMVCVPPSSEPGKCPVCGMDLKAQKSSGDSKDKYGLKLDQASIRIANIKTVAAEAKPLVRQIHAIGEISYDEGSLATISAYVDGRIEKLFADYTGVKVTDGDELAILYSPDLYSSQVSLIESIKLIDRQNDNQRINQANNRLYQSSRQRLIELGLPEQQVDEIERTGEADSRIRVVSPIAGTVIEKMAVEGQYVKTGQAIYQVADLASVWLMLELFPRDAANVCFGQKVITKIQSLPGKEFIGRVAFIDPTVDRKTQTVSVRVVIPNEKGLLRVGDFATATITAAVNSPADQEGAMYDPDLVGKWISPRHPHVISDEPGKCSECGMNLVPASEFGFLSLPVAIEHDVVVPRDAILMAGDDSVAYVETESGRFEYRNVEIGQIVGDQVSIVKGIKDGERVVASATLLVDSQFNMAGKPSLIDPSNAIPGEPSEIDEFNSPEVIAALAELSEADQQSVKNQKRCPVADMTLGSMGTPISVYLDDRRVWICCAGCEKALRDEPDKYLAIIDAAIEAELEEQAAIETAMAELSEEDRTLALNQKLCPVADMLLGSMGAPIKVDVDGQPVFICCEGCRKSLLKEPQKYLDILAQGPSKQADPKVMELPLIKPLDEPPQMSLPQMSPPDSGEVSGTTDESESREIAEALASLSTEDQQLARQQKTCPVADMPLGSMGTPIKVDVNGQPVFICCEGCRKRLLDEPTKYLAKLPGEEIK